MEEEENIIDKQAQIKQKIAPLLPYQWKKGQSGNLAGRPKGKTMKEYAREYLSRLSDEERDEWLEGIEKKDIWKMAEGNPTEQTDLYVKELPKPILDVIQQDNSN